MYAVTYTGFGHEHVTIFILRVLGLSPAAPEAPHAPRGGSRAALRASEDDVGGECRYRQLYDSFSVEY
jgi:hypothetical protein